jgi:Ca2+-binding RTX toxin-like protein
MATRTVGPNSTYPTIAAAMLHAGPNDLIMLEPGYSNETATITHSGITVFGEASSVGIVLHLAMGISTFTLTGLAPINIFDAADGNGIVGNAGNNRITVRGGVDAVDGGLGIDRLIVDYRHATGAVTGDSTSNFTEAGGGGRTVTITDGTIEHFTVLTGAGADTITTGDGNDIIKTGHGASTVTAGQGHNIIIGGRNADTITALDGGNYINGGAGTNTITSGGGADTILTGSGADTVVSGGGHDLITLRGGADTVDAGAGSDRLIIDYSAMTSAVTGGISGGNLATGYVGHLADTTVNILDFQRSEAFNITTGSGDDHIWTGAGADNLRGGSGQDTLAAGGGSDRLFGGGGNDRLHGGNGNDRMAGGDGNDLLRGGAGGDVLFGGAGADWLIGGLGTDVHAGGNGADSFVFYTAAEIGIGAARDRIFDFVSGVDHINLSAMSLSYIGGASFSHTAGELRFFSNASNGVLTGDVDGDGIADFALFLHGVTAITAGDMIL